MDPLSAHAVKPAEADGTPTYVLAVDPSQRRSAAAWRVMPGRSAQRWMIPKGVENLAEAIRGLALEIGADAKLCVLIECPTWSGDGTKEVRAACVAWERVLRKTFKGAKATEGRAKVPKCEIRRVDPRVWQIAILKGSPGYGGKNSDTKRASTWYASKVLGISEAARDADLADALCILEYATSKYNQGLFIPKPPRKKKPVIVG